MLSDGSKVPNAEVEHYTWDPNTLPGTAQVTLKVAVCGQQAGYTATNKMQLRQ